MDFARTSRRGGWVAAVVLSGSMFLVPGCVTRGTHSALQSEHDRCSARVALLERSNTSLSAERVALFEELENLREQRESLEQSVTGLERTRAKLDQELKQTEAQLAKRSAEIGELRGTYDELIGDLEDQVAAGEIEIEQLREGLRLNVAQEILFAPGSSTLNARGRGVLRKVSTRLREMTHKVEVQGHTDNVPIRSQRYPSNWELAAARASEVVRLFEREGVSGRRLTAVSFGETRPVASNDTPKGRARNRRIEIRLLPVDAPSGSGQPASRAPTGE